MVHSITKQTMPVNEIIVVDDASQDNSLAILNELPVRVKSLLENKGPAVARNVALELATSDIVLYIDSDAIADIQLVEILNNEYLSDQSNNLAGIGGRGIESNSTQLYDRWRTLHARQDFGLQPRSRVPYLFGLCMSYRRTTLLQVGGFDPYYRINAGEDLDLGYRLTNAGYRLAYTPQAVVYHQHTDDEERLKRIQYNWYYWSYLAKKRTGNRPWMLLAGSIRRVIFDTLNDYFVRRDPELARLDIAVFPIKLHAMRAASRVTG